MTRIDQRLGANECSLGTNQLNLGGCEMTVGINQLDTK